MDFFDDVIEWPYFILVMSLKSRLLKYVIDSVLVRLKLMPITAQNHIHFMAGDDYARKLPKTAQAFTDIVVRRYAIEQHEYFRNPHEAYSYTSYATTQAFLRAFVKQRLEWHLTFQVKSSAINQLHGKSDLATLTAAQATLHADRQRIREANLQRLEQQLSGVHVKLASCVMGV